MELLFIGNEGVLLRSGGATVMIDGLFGDGAAPYATIGPEVIEAIETGRDRFAGVDVIVATHYHHDHFDPNAVARYLRAVDGAAFVSTHQSADLVTGRAVDLAGRVHSLPAREGVRETLPVGAVTVHGFGLSHGKVNYGNVQHLGVVVEMPGGESVLHLGDGIIAERTLDEAGVFDMDLTAACLPFWYLTYPVGRRVSKRLRAGRLLGMHIPPADRAEIERAMAEAFPAAVPLVTPLATMHL